MRETILGDVRRLRAAIRFHRDQKGDNRCWLDDWRLWKHLADTVLDESVIPADAMARCVAYYRHRRSDRRDPFPDGEMNLDTDTWDDDLDAMDEEALSEEFERLRETIATHRDVNGRERTVDDDRALYAVLPEKIPADFRLPPEDQFLGETLAPHAGCPAFWRSHSNCSGACHNLHAWGPCGQK